MEDILFNGYVLGKVDGLKNENIKRSGIMKGMVDKADEGAKWSGYMERKNLARMT